MITHLLQLFKGYVQKGITPKNEFMQRISGVDEVIKQFFRDIPFFGVSRDEVTDDLYLID